MKMDDRTLRSVKISTSLDSWMAYQAWKDRINRDELLEAALLAYWKACAGSDSGVPPLTTKQPMQSDAQDAPETGG